MFGKCRDNKTKMLDKEVTSVGLFIIIIFPVSKILLRSHYNFYYFSIFIISVLIGKEHDQVFITDFRARSCYMYIRIGGQGRLCPK